MTGTGQAPRLPASLHSHPHPLRVSCRGETPGTTQDVLERLSHSAGLEMPGIIPGELEEASEEGKSESVPPNGWADTSVMSLFIMKMGLVLWMDGGTETRLFSEYDRCYTCKQKTEPTQRSTFRSFHHPAMTLTFWKEDHQLRNSHLALVGGRLTPSVPSH